VPTLIYSPGVKVYISTARHGIVDVSEDLTEGTMVRRSDGISTFNFAMSNPRRKYDTVFTPNDRIVVVMKRLRWLRTFTGLLNTVPLVSAWPRTVNIAASCSLKRLMYWYWDSYAGATQNMIAQSLHEGVAGTDGGVTGAIHTILNEVVGWPSSKVHIGQIPDNWFDIAAKVAGEVDALAEQSDQLRAQQQAILGSGAVLAGESVGTAVSGVLAQGTYGGKALTKEQVGFAEIIISVGRSMGASERDQVTALATAMQESRLRNLDYGDRDSLGLFQQRPSQGWGTPSQIQNPTYAAKKFYEALFKIAGRDRMRVTEAAQAVQRSGFPDAYQQWVPMAQALVVAASKQAAPPGTVGSAPRSTAGASTGAAMAQVGIEFVQKYRVMYRQHANDSANYLAQEPPPWLDCGTFQQAMYMRTTGSLGGMPRTVTNISEWALRNGGRRLTVEEAFKTPGAMLIKYREHIEMSIGDGKTTVGAKRTGKPAQLETWPISEARAYWDYGVTLPGLTYSIGNQVVFSPNDGGTTTGGDAAAVDVANPTTGAQAPGYNPNDPIDRLFGNNAWYPEGMGGANTSLSEALTGVRALMNDQPLLPYLMNLFNSTMRSFCSAPNGDLIAWFPDYYGIWGTAAKLVVEPIEVLDFNVEWSDDSLVTHQFTLAGKYNYLDISSGSVDTQYATGEGADIRTQTVGIATIDIPSVMWSLFGIEATPEEAANFAKYIYRRFGARPNYTDMPGLVGPKAEFFSALFMFMRTWAYQYNADIPLTFMPEAWPGMLIQVPAFDFQAYITTVTHSFRFGDGGAFTTTVNIASPARMPKVGQGRDNVLLGMPLAGNYKPGRGVGNLAVSELAQDLHSGEATGQRRSGGPIL
jgi:hypothetical protein